MTVNELIQVSYTFWHCNFPQNKLNECVGFVDTGKVALDFTTFPADTHLQEYTLVICCLKWIFLRQVPYVTAQLTLQGKYWNNTLKLLCSMLRTWHSISIFVVSFETLPPTARLFRYEIKSLFRAIESKTFLQLLIDVMEYKHMFECRGLFSFLPTYVFLF